MEKDINNNQEGSSSFSDPINWKSLGFFSTEDYLTYVFKKAERITAALYLVTGLLKDTEPLKRELRDRAIDFLSASFMLSSSLPGDKNVAVQSLFSAALETISFLKVAHIAGLISDMNHRIIIREMDGVVSLLRDRLAHSAENAGYVLSDSFFKTSSLFPTSPISSGSPASPTMSQQAPQPSAFRSGASPIVREDAHKGQSQGHANISQQQVVAKKTDRQDAIVNLLKGHSNLTIKDFSKVITDCSEKTIQRELLDLVDRGIIKKQGERRWSTYSLK